MFKVVPEVPKTLLIYLNSCFFILVQLDVHFFLLFQIVDLSPGFLPFFGSLYIFISLCTAFTSSFILYPYSTFLWASWLPVFWTLHVIGWLSPCHLVLFLKFWSVLSFGPYFFVSAHLLHCKGRSLSYSPGWGNTLCCIVALCGGGEDSEREECCLLSSGPTFKRLAISP